MYENTFPVEELPIEKQIAAWSATESDIRSAVDATNGITVADHAEGPKKGREAVHRALMSLVRIDSAIEAKRAELKRPILELGRLVDSEAKRLTAITAPRRAELQADRDAYDAEQARIAAEIEAERQRLEAEKAAEAKRILQAKIQRVADLGAIPDVVAISSASDEEFEAIVAAAAEAQAARIAREAQEVLDRQIAQARREQEERERRAEENRLRAEREALEAKERAEREARAAIVRSRSAQAVAVGWAIDSLWLETATEDEFQAHLEKAKSDKIRRDEEAADMERRRRELAEAEAKIRAEQARIEAEKAEEARKAEAARIAEEKRIADEEAAKLEAERKAKAEEAEREMAALLAAKAERERPEREKVTTWIERMELELWMNSPVILEEGVSVHYELAREEIAASLKRLKAFV